MGVVFSALADLLFVCAVLAALVLLVSRLRRDPSAPLAEPATKPEPRRAIPPPPPSGPEAPWAWTPPTYAPVYTRRLHGVPMLRDASDDERLTRAHTAAREAQAASLAALRRRV